jgi:hypothetical protein
VNTVGDTVGVVTAGDDNVDIAAAAAGDGGSVAAVDDTAVVAVDNTAAEKDILPDDGLLEASTHDAEVEGRVLDTRVEDHTRTRLVDNRDSAVSVIRNRVVSVASDTDSVASSSSSLWL